MSLYGPKVHALQSIYALNSSVIYIFIYIYTTALPLWCTDDSYFYYISGTRSSNQEIDFKLWKGGFQGCPEGLKICIRLG